MTDNLNVRILRMHPDATLPLYAHEGDAGMDLCSVKDYIIHPGKREMIQTGLAMAIPLGYEGQVRPRSGLAKKYGIMVVNSPGTVDSHYRGEVCVLLINHGEDPFVIKKGDRIAQLLIKKVERATFEEVLVLDETVRGADGFGSTGGSAGLTD